jgi:hypothetical protein
MAATAGHRLTLDPMGKCSNAFFSETTNIIKAKLYMNVHWMVLYKLLIFVVSEKAFEHFSIGFKEKYMYCGGGHLGFPIGIKNRLGQLKPNCPGMIIGRSSTKYMLFMSIGNPRWPQPQYID